MSSFSALSELQAQITSGGATVSAAAAAAPAKPEEAEGFHSPFFIFCLGLSCVDV